MDKKALTKNLGIFIVVSVILAFGLYAVLVSAQSAVNLGTANNFSVLAGSGITNTGNTLIVGDVGTFPTLTETGFGSVTLTGTNHVGDAVTQEAKTNLTDAYNDVAGRTPASTVASALGGTTKTPGIYNSSDGTFGITGDLTLDAQGNSSAVFIFQAASTLITLSNSNVLLTNSAKARNVYWQVGSSATLGTYSLFKGNILALTDITITTGANVSGRILAQNGAVTLDTNEIIVPTCMDADDDGYGDASGNGIAKGCSYNGIDCNDASASTYPGATDTPGNDADENCNGFIVCYNDADSDGFGTTTSASGESSFTAVGGIATTPSACGSNDADLWDNTHNDCNDASAAINPGAAEVCNNVDDNCGGGIDEGLTQSAGDLGACSGNTQTCAAGIWNNNSETSPSAETCNSIDDDCDGSIADDGVDESWYNDPTSCSIGECARSGVYICSAGSQTNTCVPGAPSAETCDGLDNDCDGANDEGLPPILTVNQDGLCAGNTQTCNGASGWLDTGTNYVPSAEVCDGDDNNCDGSTDESLGTIPDDNVNGLCSANVKECTGGVWTPSGTNYVPSAETCDNNDENCDGTIDEGLTQSAGDLGICFGNTETCNAGSWIPNNEVTPAIDDATCDGTDDDCDGSDDEDYVSDISCFLPGECASFDVGSSCSLGLETLCSTGSPSAETCDGLDNDCDASVDNGLTPELNTLQDGVCALSERTCTGFGGWVDDYLGVSDYEATTEATCDGLDNNCDGSTDEGTLIAYYLDSDTDTFGDTGSSTLACSQPGGYVANNWDCDDTNPFKTLDCIPPTFVKAWQFDTDGDGNIDEIIIEMDESISDTTSNKDDFTLNGGIPGDFPGIKSPGVYSIPDGANDTYITLDVAGRVLGTGPATVSYTQGTLADNSTNLAVTNPAIIFDDQAVPLSVVTMITIDPITLINNVQTVELTYTEAMDSFSTPTITFAGAVGAFTSTGPGYWSPENITYTESFIHNGTAEETIGVSVSSTGGATDLAGNAEGASTPSTFDIDTVAPPISVDSIGRDTGLEGPNTWAPSVNWGDSTTCEYIYSGSMSYDTANCLNGGSDILPPPGDSGTFTLYINGTDAAGNRGTADSGSFEWDGHNPDVSVLSLGQNTGREGPNTWAPNVSWDDSTTCEYSYDAGYSYAAVNCSNNGSDIPDPVSAGYSEAGNTFYVKGTDAADNIGTDDSGWFQWDETAPFVELISSSSQTYNTLSSNPQTIQMNFYEEIDLSNPLIVSVNGAAQTVDNCSDLNVLTWCFDYTLPLVDLTTETINITGAKDLAGNIMLENSTNTFDVDTILPTLSSVSVESNNANTSLAKSGDNVNITFVVSEALNQTPIVTIDGNAETVLNPSPSVYIATRTMQAGDTEGIIAFTIDFNDAAGNPGIQVTDTTDDTNVTFDENGPVVTLTKNSSTTSSLLIDISASDAGVGWNGTCVYNSTVTTLINVTGLSCGTSYNYTAICYDSAGNSGTLTSTFNTNSCPAETTSSGGSTGGAAYATFSLSDIQLEAGYSRDFALGGGITFKVGGVSHSGKIIAITADYITIEVMSEPQRANLSVGETMKFDVNADGTYDLAVKVNSINIDDKTASVSFNSIIEGVTAKVEPSNTPAETEKETLAEQFKESPIKIGMISAFIVIVVALIVYATVRYSRKKKHANSHHIKSSKKH
jgi:hypothetical protein